MFGEFVEGGSLVAVFEGSVGDPNHELLGADKKDDAVSKSASAADGGPGVA